MRFIALVFTLAFAIPAFARAADVCPHLIVPKAAGDVLAMRAQRPQVPPPKRHVRMPDGPLASASITLSRGPCFGTCPIYKVTLSGDGRGAYDGNRFVVVLGHHELRVATDAFACLLQHVREADFWSLAPVYAAQITDMPTYEIAVTVGGQTRTLVDYVGQIVGMPAAVSVLEEEVDKLGGVRWAFGDADTIPALRSEGFDFKSAEAADLLARAAARAPDEVVLGLLGEGAPVTGHADGFRGPSADGPTALDQAKRANRIVLIEALVKAGAKP